MQRFRLEQRLPSCRVSKGLLRQLENYLLQQIPRLLKGNMASMMEVLELKSHDSLKNYGVLLQDRAAPRELGSIAEYKEEKFHPSLRRVEQQFRIGRPEILAVRIRFIRGERPELELSTVSRQVKALCPGIADGLCGIVDAWANRNRLLHSRAVQLLIVLSLPAAFVSYGHLRRMDTFALYSSQGWLVLLAGALSLILPRLFPYVTFQTRRHFNIRKLMLLALFGLTLAAISGYVGLLVLELSLL